MATYEDRFENDEGVRVAVYVGNRERVALDQLIAVREAKRAELLELKCRQLEQKIAALEAKNAELVAENEELAAENRELRYRPGGPGYEEAAARFAAAAAPE